MAFLKFLVPRIEAKGPEGEVVKVESGLSHFHVGGNTTLKEGDCCEFSDAEAKRLKETFPGNFVDVSEGDAKKSLKQPYENKAVKV